MSQPLFASNQYCDVTIVKSHVGLGYGRIEKAPLDTDTDATLAITTSEANFTRQLSYEQTHSLSLSFDTLYTIMNFDGTTPMTNGHLHTWGLSLTGNQQINEEEIFYSVTPTLSVSSNILKNPELITSESLQLKTSLVYKKHLHPEYAWVVGFMSDSRFGDYRLYPLAGFCWQPQQGWVLQLALPDFSIRKTFSNGINLTLYASPEGNNWHVASKDLQRDSALSYHTIVTGIIAQWSISPAVELSLDIEKQTRREFSIVLDDNSEIEANARSSMEFTLRGSFLF